MVKKGMTKSGPTISVRHYKLLLEVMEVIGQRNLSEKDKQSLHRKIYLELKDAEIQI